MRPRLYTSSALALDHVKPASRGNMAVDTCFSLSLPGDNGSSYSLTKVSCKEKKLKEYEVAPTPHISTAQFFLVRMWEHKGHRCHTGGATSSSRNESRNTSPFAWRWKGFGAHNEEVWWVREIETAPCHSVPRNLIQGDWISEMNRAISFPHGGKVEARSWGQFSPDITFPWSKPFADVARLPRWDN